MDNRLWSWGGADDAILGERNIFSCLERTLGGGLLGTVLSVGDGIRGTARRYQRKQKQAPPVAKG